MYSILLNTEEKLMRYKGLALLLTILLLLMPKAHAQTLSPISVSIPEQQPLPTVNVRWVEGTQEVLEQDVDPENDGVEFVRPFAVSWGFVRNWVPNSSQDEDEYLPEQVPALIVKMNMRIPDYWHLSRARGDFIHLTQTPIIQSSDGKIQEFYFALQASNAVMKLEFEMPGGKTKKMTLAFKVMHNAPFLVNLKNCDRPRSNFVVTLHPTVQQAKHLFIAYTCEEHAKDIELRFYRSADARWGSGLLDQGRPQVGFGYRIPKPPYSNPQTRMLFKVATRDNKNNTSEYNVWQEFVSDDLPLGFFFGIGPTIVTYNETNGEAYYQLSLTGKGSIKRPLPWENWDIAVSSYFTTLVLNKTRGFNDGIFFGLNFRVGYTFPQIVSPWSLSLLGGWYYATMVVKDNQYGYKDQMGPQIYPTARYKTGPKDSFYAYVKYCPIVSATGLTFNNHEFAGGAGWTHVLSKSTSYSIGFDIAGLKAKVKNNSLVDSNSYSLGFGYGF